MSHTLYKPKNGAFFEFEETRYNKVCVSETLGKKLKGLWIISYTLYGNKQGQIMDQTYGGVQEYNLYDSASTVFTRP